MSTIGFARTGMDVGYARVSTGKQTLDRQQDALAAAGCGKVFTKAASWAKADRPVLDESLAYLRPGDTLVVWRLDRLGRSLQHLIAAVATLRERGIGFKSLTEQIDTTTRLTVTSLTPVGRIAGRPGVRWGAAASSRRGLRCQRDERRLPAVGEGRMRYSCAGCGAVGVIREGEDVR